MSASSAMSIRGLKKKKQQKTFKVKVITMEAEMEFSCEVSFLTLLVLIGHILLAIHEQQTTRDNRKMQI